MAAVLLVVAALVALGLFELLAWTAGVDSTDGINSREYQQRRDWASENHMA